MVPYIYEISLRKCFFEFHQIKNTESRSFPCFGIDGCKAVIDNRKSSARVHRQAELHSCTSLCRRRLLDFNRTGHGFSPHKVTRLDGETVRRLSKPFSRLLDLARLCSAFLFVHIHIWMYRYICTYKASVHRRFLYVFYRLCICCCCRIKISGHLERRFDRKVLSPSVNPGR